MKPAKNILLDLLSIQGQDPSFEQDMVRNAYLAQVVQLGQKDQIRKLLLGKPSSLPESMTQVLHPPAMAVGEEVPLLQGGQDGPHELGPGCYALL